MMREKESTIRYPDRAARSMQRAFSLAELSIVLLTISVVIGMAVSSGISVVNTGQVAATNQKMAMIDQALMAFRLANDRIPCPADLTQTQGSSTYGTEGTCVSIANGVFVANNSTNTAAALEGGVPTTALGLPNDFIYDAWGSRIRYAVDKSMTSTGAFTGTPLGAVCGAITIKGGPAYPAANTRSSGAVYALISHGPNMHGGITKNAKVFNAGSLNTDEQTNCHCDSGGVATAYSPIYVQEAPTTQDTTTPLKNFDDIVTYKDRWQMPAAWGEKTGSACPAIYTVDLTNNKIWQYYASTNTWISMTNSFSQPTSVAVDSLGNIYVTDKGNKTVHKYTSSTGSWNATFISGLTAPDNIYIDSHNNIYVSDMAANNNIKEYSLTGYLLATYTDSFSNPGGVAVDNSGTLWVADSTNNALKKYTGNTWTTVSDATHPAPGGFSNPTGLFIDNSGNVWIADSNNNRIVEYTPSSSTWATYGSLGASAGQFSNPQPIAVDTLGNIYVGEATNNRIQMYNGSWNIYANAAFGIYGMWIVGR